MKDKVKNYGHTFVIAAVVAVVTAGGPVLARSVVDFARDAHKVDGRHAVGSRASLQERAGKLVATNRKGRLPNNIIRKAAIARDAERLGGSHARAYLRGCNAGAIRGQAHVSADVGSEFEPVPGFSTGYGGAPDRYGVLCHLGEPQARRVGPGVYDVRLASIAWTCTEPMRPDIATVVATVQSAQPLVATYEPRCENGVYVRVRIADLDGVAHDAPFSVALLDENGLPMP